MSAAAAAGPAGTLACEQAAVGVRGRAPLAVVSAAFRAGRVAAIVGPNGAGKSTLLSMLSGERVPLAGRIALDGRSLADTAAPALALRRAVMPQEGAVAFDFTVREVVELGRFPHRLRPSPREDAIGAAALEATGVAHLAGRGIQRLSGGEKARAHLARALAQLWEPLADGAARWLLLDEPTAALDLAWQHRCLGLLRQRAREEGVGVVAVLHDLNLALRYADDALLLGPAAGGGAVFGPVGEVLEAVAIERTWGVSCTPATAADGTPQFLIGGTP